MFKHLSDGDLAQTVGDALDEIDGADNVLKESPTDRAYEYASGLRKEHAPLFGEMRRRFG